TPGRAEGGFEHWLAWATRSRPAAQRPAPAGPPRTSLSLESCRPATPLTPAGWSAHLPQRGSPHARAGSPLRTDYGNACVVPWSATAPGPGRSAAESTSELKVSGMQKMLASFAGLAGPPVVSAPAGAPVST